MSRDGIVSSESIGGQGLYSNVELIEHEEHRLARHAGKVVFETPAAEEVRHVNEPRHPTVKDATAAMYKHATGLYSKGLAEGEHPNPRRVVRVESIFPTREQIEEFEVARTEMQRDVAPEKLQTHQNMFYAPSDSQLRIMLDKSFSEAIQGNTVAFCTDPEQAVREGFSQSNHLLICRVVQSASVRTLNNKLIIRDTRGVQPTFILTLSGAPAAANATKN